VGLRAGLDDVEKSKFLILPGLEPRLLGRPARSRSLCRLRYPQNAVWSVESQQTFCLAELLTFNGLHGVMF
jgi:hypothetical protein